MEDNYKVSGPLETRELLKREIALDINWRRVDKVWADGCTFLGCNYQGVNKDTVEEYKAVNTKTPIRVSQAIDLEYRGLRVSKENQPMLEEIREEIEKFVGTKWIYVHHMFIDVLFDTVLKYNEQFNPEDNEQIYEFIKDEFDPDKPKIILSEEEFKAVQKLLSVYDTIKEDVFKYIDSIWKIE